MGDWKSMSDVVDFDAKAAAASYIVLGLCLSAPTICPLVVIIFRPELFASWAPLLFLGVGVLALVGTWLRAFRVRLHKGEVVYRTLFSYQKTLPIARITRAKFVRQYDPWAEWGKPRVRLDLFADGGEAPALSINLKVFSARDVRYLLAFFRA
jgi:hypothetical protein